MVLDLIQARSDRGSAQAGAMSGHSVYLEADLALARF